MSNAHERPDMSIPPTEQEAFLIHLRLHENPHWYTADLLPLTEQEAAWLIAYISYVHAAFHPQMIPFKSGTQPERKYEQGVTLF